MKLVAMIAELEENKLELEVAEAKQVELVTKLEAEATSLVRLCHKMKQVEV